jgi:hypothetical protein
MGELNFLRMNGGPSIPGLEGRVSYLARVFNLKKCMEKPSVPGFDGIS